FNHFVLLFDLILQFFHLLLLFLGLFLQFIEPFLLSFGLSILLLSLVAVLELLPCHFASENDQNVLVPIRPFSDKLRGLPIPFMLWILGLLHRKEVIDVLFQSMIWLFEFFNHAL